MFSLLQFEVPSRIPSIRPIQRHIQLLIITSLQYWQVNCLLEMAPSAGARQCRHAIGLSLTASQAGTSLKLPGPDLFDASIITDSRKMAREATPGSPAAWLVHAAAHAGGDDGEPAVCQCCAVQEGAGAENPPEDRLVCVWWRLLIRTKRYIVVQTALYRRARSVVGRKLDIIPPIPDAESLVPAFQHEKYLFVCVCCSIAPS